MITRRRFAKVAGLTLVGVGSLGRPGKLLAAGAVPGKLAEEFARLEGKSGGRLGVAVLDTGTGMRAGHRQEERFPMCSTFKLLAAAAVLDRVDAGKESLDRRIRFEAADILSNAPITKDHIGGDGMTIAELCAAAITLSDNTAANLLLASFGGPGGLTAYVRKLGDSTTRLDRNEPSLNTAVPGDPRDTTTPSAMLSTLQALTLGQALSVSSRERLIGWLVANKTGDARLRAGLPKTWRVGDKTGAGAHGTTNDVAIAWPPGRAPLLICTYLTGSSANDDGRNAILAAVALAVAAGFS
jgi:beta-lactamase class A